VGVVDLQFYAIGASLFGLCALLVILCVRSALHYRERRVATELMWGGGLALAAGAMAVEAFVYLGYVNSPLLQLYVFLSAAIVGILSLGATKVLRSPRIAFGYTVYTLGACAAVGVACLVTPLSTGMVTQGIITGNPPLSLILLSTLVTGPATIVLLAASVVSLRRSWRIQTLLMVAGALILGAGGTLYIASFPVALYYAEFIGIFVLFLGLVSLPQPAPRPAGAPTSIS
jgi:hypothetical protein